MNVGIGYRSELDEQLMRLECPVPALEVPAEMFTHRTPAKRQALRGLRARSRLVAHSVGLSIGSVERPPVDYVDAIARVVETSESAYLSDHFAITRAAGRELSHFSPIWYDERSLELVVDNLCRVRRTVGVPICLEIIAEPFQLHAAEWDQARFAREVHQASGCGILLDVTNIYINAHNFGFCPRAFIQSLPAAAVKIVHVVGYGGDPPGELADTHDRDIQPSIWELLSFALSLTSPEFVFIERDGRIPELSSLLTEAARIRTIGQARALGGRACAS